MTKSKLNLYTAFLVVQFMFLLWLTLSNRNNINNDSILAAIIAVLVAFFASCIYFTRKRPSSRSELK